MNRALPSLHGGSHEITLTVPFHKTKIVLMANILVVIQDTYEVQHDV